MNGNRIRFQPTPNPNSMKFTLEKPVIQKGMANFNSREEADGTPVAKRLFEIDGVTGVLMMENFVSVNKSASGNWGVIVPLVVEILQSL